MKSFLIVVDNGAVVRQEADSEHGAVNAFLTQVMGHAANMPITGPSNARVTHRGELPGPRQGKPTAWRIEWDNGFGFNVSEVTR